MGKFDGRDNEGLLEPTSQLTPAEKALVRDALAQIYLQASVDTGIAV